MNNSLPPKSDNEIKTDIAEECLKERVRQASYSFNAALGASVVTVCIALAWAGLVLSGKVPEGTVAASGGIGGMAASASCMKFAKDANDRLDKLMKELMDEA